MDECKSRVVICQARELSTVHAASYLSSCLSITRSTRRKSMSSAVIRWYSSPTSDDDDVDDRWWLFFIASSRQSRSRTPRTSSTCMHSFLTRN